MTPSMLDRVAAMDAAEGRTVMSPVESMTDALVTENSLLEEIIAIMRRQRTAVSADDLQAVDDSVFATHRVLVTLNEARRRRRAINVLFGEREDLPITQLDAVLGAKMTSQLSEAREALHATARKLSREVAMNRGILRQALASGDAYARVLTGAQPDPVYTAGQAPRRAGGANLFDRRI